MSHATSIAIVLFDAVEFQYRHETAQRNGAPTLSMLRRLRELREHLQPDEPKAHEPKAHEHNAVRFDINPKPGTGLLVDECSCGARRTRDYRGLVGEGGSPKITPWRRPAPKRARKRKPRNVGRRGRR